MRVGQAPLDYLTGWRIELDAKRLLLGRDPVAVIARAVGYGSESALSTAFKRVVGVSRDYRRRGLPMTPVSGALRPPAEPVAPGVGHRFRRRPYFVRGGCQA